MTNTRKGRSSRSGNTTSGTRGTKRRDLLKSAAMAAFFAAMPNFVMKAYAQKGEPIQKGGELKVYDMFAYLNIVDFDNLNWPTITNLHQIGSESLLRGDLKRGPGGTKEYSFVPTDYLAPAVIEGSLVERWQLLENPLRVEFKVRPGVMWMAVEGVMPARPLVAADIVKSYEALMASPRYPALWPFVDRWEAPDDKTAVVYLKSFDATWSYFLAWGYYDAIVPQERLKLSDKDRADWRKIGGTGPYRLVDVVKDNRMVYEKNKNYWDKAVINGVEEQLPLVDRITRMTMRDEAGMIADLVSGAVDMVQEIPWQYMKQIQSSAPDLIINKYNRFTGTYIGLRVDQKPFDDVRVRRALNIAIDHKAILNSVMGGAGEILNWPFSSEWTDVYTPISGLSPEGQELFSYNPAKAKALIAEAKLSGPLTFDVIASADVPWHLDVLAMVKAYYSAIGVTMNIKPMESASFRAQRKEATRTAAYMMDNGSTNPQRALQKSVVTGNIWNPTYYSDPAVDKKFEAASAERDAAARIKVFKELNHFYIEKLVPQVWIPTPAVFAAWWPWVKNYNGEIANGAVRQGTIYSRLWIDQNLKKKMGF